MASANKAPFERLPSILTEDVQLPFSNAYVPKLTHEPLWDLGDISTCLTPSLLIMSKAITSGISWSGRAVQ